MAIDFSNPGLDPEELEAVCAQLGLTVGDLPARLWD